MTTENTLVAVYGTLKKGGSNDHHLYSEKFIGSGHTEQLYPLVLGRYPFLIDKPTVGNNIEVELYSVSPDALASLDRLEGHPNLYRRKKINIVVDNIVHNAYVYFVSEETTKRLKGWEKATFHKTYIV